MHAGGPKGLPDLGGAFYTIQDKATLEVFNQRSANTALVPETMTTAYLPTFAACRSSLSEHVTTPSVCAPK